MAFRPRHPGFLPEGILVAALAACSSLPDELGPGATSREARVPSPAPAAALPSASVGCSAGLAPAAAGCPPPSNPPAPVVEVLADEVDELEGARPGMWPAEVEDVTESLPRGDDPEDAQRSTSLAAGATTAPFAVPPRDDIDPERALAAVAKETAVQARPSHKSRKLGYLRAGAVVARGVEPVTTEGCSGGWYPIEPEGFVCVGSSATLDVNHPIVTASRRRPRREAPLPYVYGMSRLPPPPFYVKVPTAEEQRAAEPTFGAHQLARPPADWDVPLEPLPSLLENGRQSPTLRRYERPLPNAISGVAVAKSGFAFLSFFEQAGRRWGLSVDLEVMPLDRLRRVEPSRFHGVVLDAEHPLPLVFVRGHGHRLLPNGPGAAAQARVLEHREAVHITGKSVVRGGVRYLETRDGYLLKDEDLVKIDVFKGRPGWVKPGRSWIDVSILDQSLVAYEGDTPVFATLVSTGVDGLGDPKKTHSTVRGQFLIHTKHVTTSMSGDEPGDEFDLRDVPYVQYFTEGYALHASYWHDGFGQPKSHGCINLSPADAAWLFEWTDPQVPHDWHGAMSLSDGTLLHVHP